jgi:uncharacterized protein YkwD
MLRTRLLLPALAAAATFIAPAAASASTPCDGAGALPTAANVEQVRSATLCLLNRERSNAGLAPLREQGSLRSAAKSYSRTMVRQGFFAHVSPGGSTMVTRIKRTSYLDGARGWSLGENIAWGTGSRSTAAQTVNAWMHSSGHRANILNGSFREIGIGISLGAPVAAAAASGGGIAATYTTDFGVRS